MQRCCVALDEDQAVQRCSVALVEEQAVQRSQVFESNGKITTLEPKTLDKNDGNDGYPMFVVCLEPLLKIVNISVI